MKDCRNMPYLYIDEGDVFGDSEFFMEEQSEEKGGQHSFTVRAIQNCEILFLSKDVCMYVYIYIYIYSI